ncbi:MAG: TRAP transporter large permease subunit, partial [Rhodobacteraceae bacterium]|nr:TRAP transporter large permease subunit [Paracoccaceae bacterium]
AEIQASGGGLSSEDRRRTPEQIEEVRAQVIADAAPIGSGLIKILVLFALMLTTAYGIAPNEEKRSLYIGGFGIGLSLLVDILLLGPQSSPGAIFALQAVPFAVTFVGIKAAAKRLAANDILRVVFPPLILIIAVLGSILGGITNPTPAAALGAGGAIMLAAFRKLQDEGGTGKIILVTAFAMVLLLLVGINFDLRANISNVGFENWVAIIAALVFYHISMGGLLFACWTLWKTAVLTPVVRETAKVTSMVFAILIGSQMLNLVIISFGGEHYIQSFLRSFEREWVVFLIVMAVLFFLGFVLDFLEIIYIVIPIVGPVIYGGTMDPKWVTIMIAVNLQTSFLTPPFGFALFYLRGVAPASVTTAHIYRGVIPFVLIQVFGLLLLWFFPSVVTIIPNLLN